MTNYNILKAIRLTYQIYSKFVHQDYEKTMHELLYPVEDAVDSMLLDPLKDQLGNVE
jgi:hypothetical protein